MNRVVILVSLCLGVICCGGGSGGSQSISEKIAQKAESYVGSTYWSYASSCCHGANTNKCNYFVYDVGRAAGAKMPTRSWWRGPIGAGVGGWGTSNNVDYWYRVTSPQRGDVVAAHYPNGVYHMGIYVAYHTTVSANSNNIGRNEWPFGTKSKAGLNKVYWRYQG